MMKKKAIDNTITKNNKAMIPENIKRKIEEKIKELPDWDYRDAIQFGYQLALTSSPAQEREVYRWVKANERLPEIILKTVKEFQEKYPTAMLTGTAALKLYGFDLDREVSDIDFIVPKIDVIPNDWAEGQLPKGFSAKYYFTHFNGIKVDIIIWNEWDGLHIDGILVTRITDLLEAKLDLGMSGTKKHLKDFYNMLLQLLETSNLPFEKIPTTPFPLQQLIDWYKSETDKLREYCDWLSGKEVIDKAVELLEKQ